MSNDSKPLMWVIVIIVVLALGGIIYSQYGNPVQDNNTYENSVKGSQTDTTISSTSTSNDDLDKDMTKVDAQMQGLDNDSANANQSSY